MLVLSRKKGEKLNIGDDIVLEVMEVRGDKVRIGITAPRDVSVHRGEVFEAIKQLRKEQEGGCSVSSASNLQVANQLRQLADVVERMPFEASAKLLVWNVSDMDEAKSFFPEITFAFVGLPTADAEAARLGNNCEVILFRPTKQRVTA